MVVIIGWFDFSSFEVSSTDWSVCEGGGGSSDHHWGEPGDIEKDIDKEKDKDKDKDKDKCKDKDKDKDNDEDKDNDKAMAGLMLCRYRSHFLVLHLSGRMRG